MKLIEKIVLLLLGLCVTVCLRAQRAGQKDYVVIVKTDSTTIRGTLTNMTDSTILVFRRSEKDRIQIPVQTIEAIKLKRPYLRTVLSDMLVGTLLLTAIYLKNTPPETFEKRDLWISMGSGASLGLVAGSIQSVFVKIRIPVNKSRQVFEKKRYRLSRYMAY